MKSQGDYALYYSINGLEKMIKERKENIERKKAEREDVGQSWTPLHIENHRQALNEEITMIEMDLHEMEEALEMKRRIATI
ncbi:MAG: hypothetical protein K0R18_404 [Bacillales bacterium]|jgi:hypothetical protein|nr:hypothetical protein [Bacillales bacterium]